MRKLSPSETRLLVIFGCVIALIANLFALRWYVGARRAALERISDLRSMGAEYRSVVAERPVWEARQRWMEANPPQAYAGWQTESAFAEDIQKSLQKEGIAIDSQSLRESRHEGDLVRMELELSLKADLEHIVRWLYSIQQPGRYIVIEEMTLKCLDKGDTMIVRLRVTRIGKMEGVAKSS
ncbi:hypothetical protein DB345_08660 [Spartobacteria bacterium LR76]|nr:hypothetical protein DB345_08660 [Spartobacteria bacterium LR76]